MTEQNRTNSLITLSLNSSVRARAIHDAYFPQNYKYAETKKKIDTTSEFAELAYVKVTNLDEKMQLVLNSSADDTLVVTSAHHELEHINQFRWAKIYNLPVQEVRTSFANNLSSLLIWEAQAFASQVEGPTLSLINDLKSNKMDMLNTYKGIYDVLKNSSTYNIKNYLQTLFRTKHTYTDSVDNIVDGFYKDMQFLDESEKETRVINARKTLIQDFFNPRNKALDVYIEDQGQQYISVWEHLKSNVSETTLQHHKQENHLRNMMTPHLKNVFKTTNFDNKIYLNDQNWYDVLGAKNALQFTDRVINMRCLGHKATIKEARACAIP